MVGIDDHLIEVARRYMDYSEETARFLESNGGVSDWVVMDNDGNYIKGEAVIEGIRNMWPQEMMKAGWDAETVYELKALMERLGRK